MAKVLNGPAEPPEWVVSATSDEGAGYEYVPGALGELFRFTITLEPETSNARMEVYIADNVPEAQLDLLERVHDILDKITEALRAQINKSN